MAVLSIHHLTIVHATTRETKTLRLLEVYPKEVGLQWPLYGVMNFWNKTGKAVYKKHQMWSITQESLKELHRELKIHAPEYGPMEDDQKDIKATR
jgi:hypothetical protein